MESIASHNYCTSLHCATEYARDVYRYLAEYSWVYDVQLTHFFVNRAWENIPEMWASALLKLSCEELNQLPYIRLSVSDIKEALPESLKEYITLSRRLSLDRKLTDDIEPIKLSKEDERGMNPKKRHEVSHATSLVSGICRKSDSQSVVDIGSGLGYLDLLLHKICGLCVLGIESQEDRTHGAQARADKLDASSKAVNSVTFKLTDTEACLTEFHNLLSHHTDTMYKQDSNPQPSQVAINENPHPENCPRLSQDNIAANSVCTSEKQTTVSCTTSDAFDIETSKPDDFSNESTSKVNSRTTKTRKDLNFVESSDVFENEIDGQREEHCACSRTVACEDTVKKIVSNDAKNDENKCATHEKSKSSFCDKCNVHNGPESEACIHGDECQLHCQTQTSTNNHVCMIGLHACGDLSATMLKTFIHLEKLQALVCIGCCYHRMAWDGTEFSQFPMSKTIRKVFTEGTERRPNLNPLAFRLAAQETRARWQKQTPADHADHERHVAYRATLELYNQTEGEVVKTRRRLACGKDYKDFNAYVSSVLKASNLADLDSLSQETIKSKLDALNKEYQPYHTYIEIFTLLQVLMQPVLESVILLDRLCYLREMGCPSAILPVFEEYISPRNLALVAFKKPTNWSELET